jgi:predicted dehydrogenase
LGTEGSVELYVPNYAREDTLTFYTEVNGAPIMARPYVTGEDIDHKYAVAQFVKCIQADTQPVASAERGLVIMNIIDAIYQSAETGREVTLK